MQNHLSIAKQIKYQLSNTLIHNANSENDMLDLTEQLNVTNLHVKNLTKSMIKAMDQLTQLEYLIVEKSTLPYTLQPSLKYLKDKNLTICLDHLPEHLKYIQCKSIYFNESFDMQRFLKVQASFHFRFIENIRMPTMSSNLLVFYEDKNKHCTLDTIKTLAKKLHGNYISDVVKLKLKRSHDKPSFDYVKILSSRTENSAFIRCLTKISMLNIEYDNIQKYSVPMFDFDLPLPSSLSILHVIKSVNKIKTLPPYLSKLHLNTYNDASLPGVLKDTIISYAILDRFNHEWNCVLPASLIVLNMNKFNSVFTCPFSNLIHLKLRAFNQPLHYNLPSTLIKLHLQAYDHNLNGCLCLDTVIDDMGNLRFDGFINMNRLKSLKLNHYTHAISHLPPHIERIKMRKYQHFPLPALPLTIQRIDIRSK